jgi:hypothetical protein
MSQDSHNRAKGKGLKAKDVALHIFVFCLLPFAFCPTFLSAQERETDLGASFSLELEKDLSRYFTLGKEE